jgi:hypothetical protein
MTLVEGDIDELSNEEDITMTGTSRTAGRTLILGGSILFLLSMIAFHTYYGTFWTNHWDSGGLGKVGLMFYLLLLIAACTTAFLAPALRLPRLTIVPMVCAVGIFSQVFPWSTLQLLSNSLSFWSLSLTSLMIAVGSILCLWGAISGSPVKSSVGQTASFRLTGAPPSNGGPEGWARFQERLDEPGGLVAGVQQRSAK